MAHAKLQEAILEAGYVPIIIVGFGERDGYPRLKVGADPAIRAISDASWEIVRETIIRALDNLRASPLDDLDIVT